MSTKRRRRSQSKQPTIASPPPPLRRSSPPDNAPAVPEYKLSSSGGNARRGSKIIDDTLQKKRHKGSSSSDGAAAGQQPASSAAVEDDEEYKLDGSEADDDDEDDHEHTQVAHAQVRFVEHEVRFNASTLVHTKVDWYEVTGNERGTSEENERDGITNVVEHQHKCGEPANGVEALQERGDDGPQFRKCFGQLDDPEHSEQPEQGHAIQAVQTLFSVAKNDLRSESLMTMQSVKCTLFHDIFLFSGLGERS